MKRLLYVASGVLAIVAMAGRSGWAAEKPAAPKYEKMLYDLGAFPAAKLTQPYWTNGHPGEVYSKCTRVDVDGWLSPYWAPSYLTEAEKVQYGIPKKLPSYDNAWRCSTSTRTNALTIRCSSGSCVSRSKACGRMTCASE